MGCSLQALCHPAKQLQPIEFIELFAEFALSHLRQSTQQMFVHPPQQIAFDIGEMTCLGQGDETPPTAFGDGKGWINSGKQREQHRHIACRRIDPGGKLAVGNQSFFS